MDINYAYTGLSSLGSSRLTSQRKTMDDLVAQQTTGLKSSTYAGVSDRSLTLAFQQKISDNASYQSTITNIQTRLEVVSNGLTAMNDVSNSVAGVLGANGFQLTSSGRTPEQVAAASALDTYVSTLDTDLDGTYLFAGKASDVKPVVDTTTMLDGDGTRAGFKTVTDQRKQADLGSDGLGRLTLGVAGTNVSLSEDGSHPFGFKVTSAASTLSNVTLTGPSGTPSSLSIDVAGQPTSGQAMTVTLTLPDGSTTKATLTAGTTNSTDGKTFAIGATEADTAANIQSALKTQVTTLGKTDLTAASAMAAANNFFDTSGGGTPKRVSGPPYDTATSLVAGTDADTVTWYTGTNDANSARSDAHAAVDDGLTVNYGIRANEKAFTSQIKALAVVSTMNLSAGSDTDKALYSAMVDRTKGVLAANTGSDSLQSVAAEIGGAQSAAKSSSTRLTVASNTYQTAVDTAMNADKTEVAVKLATLQTQMEASYKATSMLYKLTLTDYL